MRIYKYPILMIGQLFKVKMCPVGKIVHVNNDPQGICSFWAEHHGGDHDEEREFIIIGTGVKVDEWIVPRGTFINGRFVWHLMEKLNEEG